MSNEDRALIWNIIQEDIRSLSVSFKTLNDSHHSLELSVNELKTKIDLYIGLVKWLIPSSLVALIVFIIELARLSGVLK